MENSTESTPLISRNDKSRCVFDSSIARKRKRRVRQFQCCLITLVLFGLTLILLASTAYTLGGILTSNLSDVSNDTDLYVLLNLQPLNHPDGHVRLTTNESEWEDALLVGEKALEERDEIEKTTPVLTKDSPGYLHQKIMSSSKKSKALSRFGYAEEQAARYLFRKTTNKNQIATTCDANLANNTYNELCLNFGLTCNLYRKYRTYNGSCNNLKHPNRFGVAYNAFRRIIEPDYADGIGRPRMGQSGKKLPSARTVSLVVHRPYYNEDPKFTVVLAVWGQFLDHDITSTALSSGFKGSTISCCVANETLHPECFPVTLDPGDPYYDDYNVSCMEFVRSSPAPTCCLGPREQMNQVSSFIDASMVYSSDADVAASLRSFKNGTLRVSISKDNRTLLPISTDLNDGCNREDQAEKGRYCFVTGDSRANENLHLTSMHLLWVRQHNLLAKNLIETNSKWDDEKVFQESRRILAAQIQHITYNEFLPILLGTSLMKSHNLYPKQAGYFEGYNDTLDASVANAFATAAFRFAHTLIPTLMKLIANDQSNPEYIQLRKLLLNPFDLYEPLEIDKTIRGALYTQLQASDPYFTVELKQHLFERVVEHESSDRVCGLDLVSLNIQRGRDHGLPGYTIWRERCGLVRPRDFQQLAGVIDDDSLNNINSIYSDVDDIDLYTGALSEIPLKDSMLGPTLTCIILDQFIRLKRGDRFWYENNLKPQAFTNQQLKEIRKTSLAAIICDNTNNIANVQPLVMQKFDEKTNKKTACSSIARLNIAYWKESRPIHAPIYGK